MQSALASQISTIWELCEHAPHAWAYNNLCLCPYIKTKILHGRSYQWNLLPTTVAVTNAEIRTAACWRLNADIITTCRQVVGLQYTTWLYLYYEVVSLLLGRSILDGTEVHMVYRGMGRISAVFFMICIGCKAYTCKWTKAICSGIQRNVLWSPWVVITCSIAVKVNSLNYNAGSQGFSFTS